jgi:hypothetical protein
MTVGVGDTRIELGSLIAGTLKILVPVLATIGLALGIASARQRGEVVARLTTLENVKLDHAIAEHLFDLKGQVMVQRLDQLERKVDAIAVTLQHLDDRLDSEERRALLQALAPHQKPRR